MFMNLSFLQCNKLTAFSENMMYFQTIINTTHVVIIVVNKRSGKRRFLLLCSRVGAMLVESHYKSSICLSNIISCSNLYSSDFTDSCMNLPVCMLVTTINFAAQFLCSANRPCLCCQILCCYSCTQLNIFFICDLIGDNIITIINLLCIH